MRDLGQGEALILRNHGALVVGRTRRRGVQLDASARARLPLADRRDVVQHEAARSAAGRARGNLEQLPARYAPAIRADGVAGPAAQARPSGPELPD